MRSCERDARKICGKDFPGPSGHRAERAAAINIEAAVTPVHQVVDEHVADLALGF